MEYGCLALALNLPYSEPDSSSINTYVLARLEYANSSRKNSLLASEDGFKALKHISVLDFL